MEGEGGRTIIHKIRESSPIDDREDPHTRKLEYGDEGFVLRTSFATAWYSAYLRSGCSAVPLANAVARTGAVGDIAVLRHRSFFPRSFMIEFTFLP